MAVRWGRAEGGRRPHEADAAAEAPGPATSSLLEVRDLKIHFPTDDGLVKAVDGVSFTLDRWRRLP